MFSYSPDDGDDICHNKTIEKLKPSNGNGEKQAFATRTLRNGFMFGISI